MAIRNLHRDSVLGSFGKNKNEYHQWKGERGQKPPAPPVPLSMRVGPFQTEEEKARNLIDPLESIKSAEVSTDIPKLRQQQQSGEPTDEFAQLMERINKAYTPETQDTSRFRDLLNQFPQRQEPSIARKLVAGGLGLDARQRVGTPGQEFTARGGGEDVIKTMEGVMYAPHLREREDWKEKAQPFYQAANLERQSNIQERQLVTNALQYQIQQEKNEIARIRAEAYALKASGHSFNFDGPTVIVTRPDGTIYDSGWPSGKMDETLKENLRAKTRVEAARVFGENQEKGARARGQDIYTLPDGSTWRLNPDNSWTPLKPEGTGQPTRPGTPRSSNELNTKAEVEIDRQRRMRAVFEKYPQHRKWFDENLQTGELTWKPKPKSTRYPSHDEDRRHWDEVYTLVNPDYRGAPSAQNQGTQNQGAPNAPPPGRQYPPPPGNTLETADKGRLKQRAAEYLRQNNLPITEANIQHAIKTGRVK